MSDNRRNDDNTPNDTESRDEEVASQEELYLEETEEELRVILTSDGQSPAQTTAEYWRTKIEELEVDWEGDIFHGRDEQ